MERFVVDNQTIVCNDCLVELKSMTDESVDIIVTSPPYNLKIDYGTYKDDLPFDGYLNWLDEIFHELNRVLKPNGSFFLNVGGTCKEPCIAMDVCQIARKRFTLQNDIVWVKSISIPEENSWKSQGHFKPIVSKRFVNQQHESVYHFTKTGDVTLDRLGIGVPYADKSNIDRWNHEDKQGKPDKRCRGNVWFLPYKTVQSRKQHPAGFPQELPEHSILLHGLRDDLIVLDPFLGAGSTLLACQKLGCQGIGIELDLDFCKMAVENLSK